MKTVYETIESKGTEVALIIIREALRQIADWKVAKISGYALRASKSGEMLYQIGGGKILPKGIRTRLLNGLLSFIIGGNIDSGLSDIVKSSTSTLSAVASVDSSRAVALDAAKGILGSTAKAGLMCALIDGVIGSVEAGYMVSKGRMNKRDAFRHAIKEASSGAISGAAGIGAVGIITALSPIPVVGQIAVLTGVSIGVKRLWNKRRV
ncbi:MAG: hypothetical protein C4291_12465 [Candidatus Dadabacteria bacterium]